MLPLIIGIGVCHSVDDSARSNYGIQISNRNRRQPFWFCWWFSLGSFCATTGFPDCRITFDITLNWPRNLKNLWGKIKDLRFATKSRYVVPRSFTDNWFKIKFKNIDFSWVWCAFAWSVRTNSMRNCWVISTHRENCTWCPLRSMKNMSFDFVQLHKMPPMMILVWIVFHASRPLPDMDWVCYFDSTIEIAWDIITDFASELLEKEQADEITEILDRKRKETLAQKRSFFVRMVSDPKIYNPAINKAGSTPRMSTDNYSPIIEGAPTIQTPRKYAYLMHVKHSAIPKFNNIYLFFTQRYKILDQLAIGFLVCEFRWWTKEQCSHSVSQSCEIFISLHSFNVLLFYYK